MANKEVYIFYTIGIGGWTA